MEYQKILNLLDNTQNEPSKLRTRNWVEINDESWEMYNMSNEIKFKTSVIRSIRNYSDAYINVKRTITVPITGTAAAPANKNRKVVFINFAPFTNCVSEINNSRVDGADDIDLVMSMYNLQECSDIYSKTLGSLWQYCRDEPALNNNKTVISFPANKNNNISFKFKEKIKYPSNCWKTLEMPLIYCEISLILTWPKICSLIAGTTVNKQPTFMITDTKLYLPVVTLSTQGNVKPLKQLELGFKRTTNWNKY